MSFRPVVTAGAFRGDALGESGVSIATISGRLGAAEVAPLNSYAHAFPVTDQRAAAYLGSLLAGDHRPAAHGG